MNFSRLLFWHYLFSKRSGSLVKVIAWINLIGVSLSVGALILVTSVMNGFNQTIEANLLDVQPHLLVHGSLDQVDLNELVEKVKAEVPKDSRVSTFETQDLVLRTIDGNFGGVMARGLGTESVSAFLTKIWGGRGLPLQAESLTLSNNEVMLGVDLARSLGIFEGDQVSLIAPETLLLPQGEGPPILKVTVKGLISLQNAEIDGNLLIYDFGQSFPERFKSASLSRGVEVFLENPHDFEKYEEALEIKFPKLKVQSWRDLNGALFFALKLERTVMTSFLALAVLIVSFTLVTVLALLVAQKRKDIGMMMAMGMSKTKTHLVFCGIGMWLSITGTLIGVGIGTVLALMMEIFPVNILPDIYYDSRIPAIWSFYQTFLVFSFSLTLAFLGSYFPLKFWLRMTPTEALRKN